MWVRAAVGECRSGSGGPRLRGGCAGGGMGCSVAHCRCFRGGVVGMAQGEAEEPTAQLAHKRAAAADGARLGGLRLFACSAL